MLGIGVVNAGHVGGVLGYWQFDEGSGTTTADASGHGNDGTLVGGPAWTTDVPPSPAGNAASLEFSGAGNHVDAGSGINVANSSFTVSAWVKP